MRRPINTVNGTYKDPNLAFSAQDALNVIPMMTEKSGTRTVSQYRQAPGLKPFCRIGTNYGETVTYAGAGRGLRVVDGKLYAVAGRNLWQITSAGVSVNYGTIPGVGRVSMAHNQRGLGNELAIDNGQSRYVFNTQTQDLQKVTDESFPGSIKAVFIDGYIVFVEPQGRYWGHSDLSNALNYNIFDQYEAEGQPDRIVSAHESNRELLIFGQDTTEAYVNNPSGSGEAPFVRATNTVIKSGCAARDSVCNVGPYTVYLDQNRTVQVLNGYTPVPISTSVIDSALQACTKQQIANAYAFAVESEGFQIYYLTVPGKFTFGYDFKNREWHRRSSTGLDWWAVTDVVQWNGSWYALDSRRGDILELRWYDYPFDVQEELVREWVTGTITADQNPIFVNELELLFGCGGQAYTTVDFPEQPVGPAISGNAPNGGIGDVYTPYQYTITEGDTPIASIYVSSGALPPGLNFSPSGEITGTPTTEGSFSFAVTVVDTSGLPAIVVDTITIGNYDSLFQFVISLIHGEGTPGSSSMGDVLGNTWIQIDAGSNPDVTNSHGWHMFGEGSLRVEPKTYGGYTRTNFLNLWDDSLDFTVEMFVRLDSVTGTITFARLRAAAPYDRALRVVDGQWSVVDAVGPTVLIAPAGTAAPNTAYHVAYVRHNDECTLYVDGIALGSESSFPAGGFEDVLLEIGDGNGASFTGYIDEYRVTRGAARYTANFTPPDRQFPDEGPP